MTNSYEVHKMDYVLHKMDSPTFNRQKIVTCV